MKRRMTFGRGLAVAFVAALIATCVAMTRWAWGFPLSATALFVVPFYLLAVAPSTRRGIASAVGAFGLLGAAAFLGFPLVGLGLLLLGVVRATLLFPSRPLRGIATECLFLGGGVVLATVLFAPGALGVGLATWGFFLVQSCYPLFAGSSESAPNRPEDPFDAAMARASALLEDR